MRSSTIAAGALADIDALLAIINQKPS